MHSSITKGLSTIISTSNSGVFSFYLSIIDEIKEDVVNYCRENNITLITRIEESSEDD